MRARRWRLRLGREHGADAEVDLRGYLEVRIASLRRLCGNAGVQLAELWRVRVLRDELRDGPRLAVEALLPVDRTAGPA